MSKTYTVYTLESSDGKMYVGATSTTLRERWNNGNGYRFIEELWHSIECNGWDSIIKTVVSEGLSHKEASLLEQELISQFRTYDRQHGYNREMGGVGKFKKVSDDFRVRMSETHVGEKNPNYGKHFGAEHRRKISESNKGQTRSIETCRRVGLAKEKAVVQLTTGGKLIAVWDSGKQASLATGTQAGHISKVCKHQRKTAGGFVWAYAN